MGGHVAPESETPDCETNDTNTTKNGIQAALSHHPRDRPRKGSDRHQKAYAPVSDWAKVLACIH